MRNYCVLRSLQHRGKKHTSKCPEAANKSSCLLLATYRSLMIRDVQNSDGFLLTYSITSYSSFEEAKTLFQTIFQNIGEVSFPVVLVANKCDAESDREVSTDGKKSSQV